ncbi:MAG TPA: cytochrome P460 family protein [Polyangia bacterium]|nr:cytochrome P460 family protein [Polyangia bacterium]
MAIKAVGGHRTNDRGDETMRNVYMWNKRLFIPAALAGALVATGALFARADDGPKIPVDFQRGLLANSMLVTKEPNNTGLLTGVHLVYVNPVGSDRFKRGGSAPYPEGTVFVDDVHEFSLDDGVYHEGGRKFLTVMVKNSKKYASTGGWGFQAWKGGDPTKPIADDPTKMCYSCHVPQKANDFVFSTVLQ